MDVGLSRGFYDLIHRHLSTVVSVRDVLGDATVEQDGLLGHEADLRAQPRQIVVAQSAAVDQLQPHWVIDLKSSVILELFYPFNCLF